MFLVLTVLAALPARAREVDLELVLAVDVSRSMSPAELELQRRGYAEALTSTAVAEAIEGGLLGRIALTYIEWAGSDSQRVIVPWTEVSSPEGARDVASRITAHYDDSLRRTSISSALRFAAQSIETNGFEGLRRVIDVSGDGPNNMGPPVRAARDEVVAQGITINGLPLMTQDALSEIWGIPDLDAFYAACVIGGPGAFVIPVTRWDAFPAAVTRKLVLEIAGLAAAQQVWRAQAPAPYDCQVGEKMWQQNRSFFDIP
ncbi:DUF1194 domain-containing protein [Sulfitobacter sp. S190]|uniref:DUF1194 domain-containing protein n=1 Tax=Sulfitobacter sp. S190 TaxID=2867022 RepID=UPI0021A68090|nr:DUF1194 domain-containing protein [Sulfitobacter sp. S190]